MDGRVRHCGIAKPWCNGFTSGYHGGSCATGRVLRAESGGLIVKNVLVLSAGLGVVLGLSVACAPQGDGSPQAEQAPAALASAALGLRLVDVPEELQIVPSPGDEIVMQPVDPAMPGRVSVAVQEVMGGVNLVAALQGHQEQIEAREAGIYSGKQELVGPFGPAFLSRGRWQAQDGEREEILLFTLHPMRNGLVILSAEHPAGDDASWRANLLLGLLGRLEGYEEGDSGT